MTSPKPIASLSLDLDNQWSYMKTHGDKGWDSYPSYLDFVVPRVLKLLKKMNLTITVFVVGQDAALDKNKEALESISAAGHEIGNHSFNHEQWLAIYSEDEIEKEFSRSEEQIERVTGQKPVGFRGPGFILSDTILRVLKRRGYLYDCSTFPTFIGPLARYYYFMTSHLSKEEMDKRKSLFGEFKDGFRPCNPYKWVLGTETLIEIPVTTMPFIKIPIHLSYILFISRYSPLLAIQYFRTALMLCRATKSQPSLLLHPLDFLGRDDIKELSFFPAMMLPSEKKISIVSEALKIMAGQFNVLTLREHCDDASRNPDILKIKPFFSK